MATDSDTARSQYENYRWCYDNGHVQWLKKAEASFNLWCGNHWDPGVKARVEAEGRPALTFNIPESLIRAMKGVQRALRHDVRFAPVADAEQEDVKVQDALWLHTQHMNDLDSLESDVYEKGLIMGRAYYDARICYENSLRGSIVIRTRRSQDVVLDPGADEYDPEHWPQITTRRYWSYTDIETTFGKEAAEELGMRDMPGWVDYEDVFMAQQMGRLAYYQGVVPTNSKAVRGYLVLDRQYYVFKMKDVFVDLQTGDISEIPENWDRNRVSRVLELTPGLGTMRHNMKTVRWDVTCENTTLHSKDSPYKRFTIVPFFPSFIDGVTMGACESWIDSANLFNKMTSQELHIINTTANSGYKVKRGSLRNMTIKQLEKVGSKSGFVAELDNVADMEKFQPNSTPQGHDRLSFKADQIMRSLSGMPNGARGYARDDASADKVEQDSTAKDVNFAGWLGNLHRSKRFLARHCRDMWASHYTDTRVIHINRGTSLNPMPEAMTINEVTPEGRVLNDVSQGQYSTVLVPAPSRTTMSESDFKLMLELRKLGLAIEDSLLIELSPASNKAQIIAAMSGGPSSVQRDAEAQRLAAEQQAVEQQKDIATAKKEEAAAMLNEARAEKAAVEAQIDPDAAYERVEQTRIASEQEMHDDKMDKEQQRIDLEREQANRQLALDKEKLSVDREKNKAQASRPAMPRRSKS
jgi:hypothetical protein